MTRYHINPKTGNPNKCSAKLGNCPFKSTDGAEAIHYETQDAAREGYEKIMEAQAEADRLAREAADELNWPAPSAEAVAEAEAAGYTVDVKGKSLGIRVQGKDYSYEISIRKGDVYANRSLKSSFSTVYRVRNDWPLSENGRMLRAIEFSDYGTQLSVEEAEEHIAEMEEALKAAPAFVSKINDTIGAAEKLFGEPKRELFKGLYAPVDALPTIAPERTTAVMDFEAEGDLFYKRMVTHQSRSLRDHRDSDPSAYVGIKGEAVTSISLSSRSELTQEDYQERIATLKDSVATIHAMKEAIAKLPKPPLANL